MEALFKNCAMKRSFKSRSNSFVLSQLKREMIENEDLNSKGQTVQDAGFEEEQML